MISKVSMTRLGHHKGPLSGLSLACVPVHYTVVCVHYTQRCSGLEHRLGYHLSGLDVQLELSLVRVMVLEVN